MSGPPLEPSDETESGGDRATDAEAAALARTAMGDSVTAARLDEPLVSERGQDEPTRLLDVLSPDERPQYLLQGVIADRVRGDGERSRRMATPGGAVFTLVTDRAVHLVVQYRDRIDVDTAPLTSVDGTTVQRAGSETRLSIRVGEERYEVYPSRTRGDETTAAAAYLDEWVEVNEQTDSAAATEDGVSGLERLATLYERGLLTESEFTAAKRDLLDG